MPDNTKRAIIFIVFALGLVLGLLGWVGDVYPSSTATILFIVCILASIGLRIMWGLNMPRKQKKDKQRCKFCGKEIALYPDNTQTWFHLDTGESQSLSPFTHNARPDHHLSS